MSTMTLAINTPKKSVLVSKVGGEVMVFSYDKQFRNSYKNVMDGQPLHGVGFTPDGKPVDISRAVSYEEYLWLKSDGIKWMVNHVS